MQPCKFTFVTLPFAKINTTRTEGYSIQPCLKQSLQNFTQQRMGNNIRQQGMKIITLLLLYNAKFV